MALTQPAAAHDDVLNNARRIALATYRHFNACLERVPEPAQAELRRLAVRVADTEKLSIPARLVTLLAHDLGIHDEAAIVRLSNATALGLLHSQLLDDVVDNKGVGDRAAIRNVYLAHIVFNFYYDAWSQIRPQPPSFPEMREFAEFEVETCAALFDEEVSHVGVSLPFASQQDVASKCAPVKAVMLQMLRLTGREDLKRRLFPAMENIAFALLLADDLADWEDDFELQRFTYPIQAAFDRLHLSYSPDRHAALKQQVGRALFFGPLYHLLKKDAVDKLTSSADALQADCPLLADWLRAAGASTTERWRGHARMLFTQAMAAAPRA